MSDGSHRFLLLTGILLTVLTLSASESVGPDRRAARPMTLGYEYDIARGKVPKPETMRRVADILSSLGYTQLQVYFKANFAYPGHAIVWKDGAYLTPEDVKAFDAYCRTRGLDLVPYQAGFGHLEPWMKHPEYRKYAEHPSGQFYCTKHGDVMKSMAVCPTNPQSLAFLNGLFDVLLPCCSSKCVNLGCDEVWDLHATNGCSAAVLREKGVGRVYLDFILKLDESMRRRGKTLMFWSDIIRHYPELVRELPPDVVALDWNYEATAAFEQTTEVLRDAPCRFYVCPGTSSWCSFFGRHANMRENVYQAYRSGTRNGAEGLLLTDWGDDGHPQPWLVSLPAIVYTAMLVKNGDRPTDAAVAAKVDEICGCRVGAYLIRLSNVYLKTYAPRDSNGTRLFWLAANPTDFWKTFGNAEHLTQTDYDASVTALREAGGLRDLTGAPDWVNEDVAVLDLLVDFVARRVAGETGPLGNRYRSEYVKLWNRQNLPGGAEASVDAVFGR